MRSKALMDGLTAASSSSSSSCSRGTPSFSTMVWWIAVLTAGWLVSVVSAAVATVTSGYYILNVFSDSSCTTYVSQQTYLLNVCYLSSISTTTQYNIGVLQID